MNGEPGTSRVANIKFMWVDYHKSLGSGARIGRDVFVRNLTAILNIYFRQNGDELARAIGGDQDATIHSGPFTATVSIHKGPAAYERLIVITDNGW